MINFNTTKIKTNNQSKLRNSSGVQMAELPPALTILFFLFLLPGLNLLYLAFAFGAGLFLNNIELRDVACHTPTSLGLYPPTGTYKLVDSNSTYGLPESQKWRGLLGITEDLTQSPMVAQFPAGGTTVSKSSVKTVVSIKPFYSMPFLKNIPLLCQIPGLGKPIVFTYYGSILQEDPGP